VTIEEKRAYHREYNRKRREANPGIDRAACNRWRQKNLDHNRERCRAWRATNQEVIRTYNRDWRSNNPSYGADWRASNRERCRAYLANYRGRKAFATPLWADADEIAAVYAEAVRLTRETGIPHEVDHIIPISGKLVCGLHVQGNLRAIPATANRMKSNSFYT
jgi:hypothetical protein